MRATSAALAAVLVVAVCVTTVQAINPPHIIKPAVPAWKLPPGSTNGTKLDAFVNASKLAVSLHPQVDVPLASNYGFVGESDGIAGPILPWSDPRIGKTVPGCAPEGARVLYYTTPDSRGPSVLISWQTCAISAYYWQGAAANVPVSPQDTSAATSRVWIGTVPGVYDKSFDGTAYSYVWDSTKFLNGSDAGGGSYASPILHHTLVSGLVPGVTYFYKIDNAPQLPNGTVQGTPFYGQFKMPGGYPLRIGMGADSGEVSNVTTNIDYTIESKPDLFVLIGDLTYANKYALDPAYCIEGAPECNYLNSKSVSTYPPRWDAYSRLFEPLMSKVPTMVAIGNHELEMTPVTSNSQIPSMLNNWNNNLFFTRFTQFLARYPLPQTAAIARNGPTAADLGPITPTTNQGKGMYYVTEVPGVATIVVLSVYTYSDQYLPTDEQYQWALDVFSKVDRAKTPWLIVAMHAGFYTTSQMFLQMECMRILYEPLFRAFSVDVIFSGHSHDAERAGPMFNWQLDKECGMNYITVGSFGPDEGITTAWVDQWNVPAAAATFPSCPNQPTIYNPNAASIPYVVTAPGQWGPGGRCIPPKLAASGDWCPSAQPDWSRFREHAYGTGTLDILSPTKAVWSFFSQEGAMLKPVDQIVITRSDPAKCAQTQATIDAAATVGVSMADVLAASKTFNATAAKSKLVDVLTHGGGAGGAALDPKGAASGVARGAGDYVAAKLGRANFTLNAVLAQLANKTG